MSNATPIAIPPEDEFKYTKIVRKHLDLIPQLRAQAGMPLSSWMPFLVYSWAQPGAPLPLHTAKGREDGPSIPTMQMVEIPVEDYVDVCQLTGCSVIDYERLGLKLYLRVPVC